MEITIFYGRNKTGRIPSAVSGRARYSKFIPRVDSFELEAEFTATPESFCPFWTLMEFTRPQIFSIADQPGSLSAKTEGWRMPGGLARSSAAFAIRAAATAPLRCAARPASSSNASKIANVALSKRTANHATVPVSATTKARSCQKRRDVFFAPRLGFQFHVECYAGRGLSPFS